MKSCRFLLGLVYLAFCCSAFAQSTDASLTGFVDDPSKALIPKVSVTAINTQTGSKTKTLTNSAGQYVLPGLSPGTYRLEVDKQGFKGIIEAGLVLHVQDVVQINFHMALGSMSETVTVNGSGVQMNTTDASVSTVVDQALISELPMNGRSLDSLFLLTPGVVSSGTQNAGGQYSVNGQRPSSNYLTVDGASGNVFLSSQFNGNVLGSLQTGIAGSTYATSASGGTNGLLPVDAIEEYRIQTSTYSAENGRSPGGQIQMRTRGGTNQFHGTVFEYFRNQVMDATDWFIKYNQLKQAPLRMNDFGGTLGGPILKNKLFFFVAHETLNLDQPNNTTTSVPSAYARQNVGATFAPFLAAYPNGNGGSSTTSTYPQYTDIYNAAYATQIVDHSTSARLDADLPGGYKTFFRFNIAPSHSSTTLWSSTNAATQLDTYTIGVTKSVTPSLLNEVTANYSKSGANYSYYMLPIDGASPSAFAQFCKASAYSPWGSSRCQFAGLSGWGFPVQGTALAANLQQWNIVEKVRWTLRRHAITFGADYRRLSTSFAPYTSDAIYAGFFNGPSAFAGSTIDQISTATSTISNLVLPVDNLSLFAQDDWHITNRLTVNYGVRWEYNPPVSDGNGGPLALAGSTSNLPGLQLAPAGTPLYKTTHSAFAPRLGFAYQLQNRQGFATVLRAGAGIFYDTGQAASTAATAGNTYPYVLSVSVKNVPFSQLNFQSIQQSATALKLPQATLRAVDPNLTLPYTGEWNVAVEQQLFGNSTVSATYLGADGEKLASTITAYGLSPALVTPTGYLQLLTNRGRSNYQALQIQATIRAASGLDGIVAYTYSHNIDNGSSDFSGPKTNVTNYRASADDDTRHIFSVGLSLKPKGLTSERLLRVATNGWIVNTFTRLQTASPLSVLSGVGFHNNIADLNSYTGFADRVPGVPAYLHGSTGTNGKPIPGGIQLNPAAFINLPVDANSLPLRDGNSGRNAYRLFGLHEFDLSAGRKFALTERIGFEFKAEAFNILNTPTFANPVVTVGSANFGQAQNTYAGYYGGNGGGGGLNTVFQSGGARSLQLTARVSF